MWCIKGKLRQSLEVSVSRGDKEETKLASGEANGANSGRVTYQKGSIQRERDIHTHASVHLQKVLLK